MNPPKVIQSLSLDAKMAYERLAQSQVDDIVTYSELSSIIGRDVQNGGRGVIRTARWKALRDKGMVFGVVVNVGLKHLSDIESISTGEHVIRKIRRASSRGFRQVTAVKDYDNLPNKYKILHNFYASGLSMLHQVTNAPHMKRLEGKVEKAQATLSLTATLEAFKDG